MSPMYRMDDWRTAQVLAGALLVMTLMAWRAGFAAEPQWPQEPFSIQVQEQPLDRFLKDFFAANNMKVLVSPSVSGRISGSFNDSPDRIFASVVKAYGLLPYYDGAVTHVSMASDVRSKSFRLSEQQLSRVLKTLIAQGLTDENQSVHVHRAEKLLKVRGAPEFVDDVEKLVAALQPKSTSTSTLRPVQVEPSQAGDEMIFRTFSLQYASAADVTLTQGGQEFTIPGVASILRNIVGDGYSPTTTSIRFGSSRSGTVPGLRDRQSDVIQTAQHAPVEPVAVTPGGVITDRPYITRIEAERNLNAVIVRDYADSMPIYEQLVTELDKEPVLIEIQVTIIDVDKSKLRDIGVNWQYNDSKTQARFGGADVVNQDGGLLLNTVLSDPDRFIARINALAVTGSADVVSRPQVLTLSNVEAVLASDQQFFVRVAGNEDVDLFNVSVGTILRVVPNVVGNRDDPQIRLLVSIEDGSLTPDAVDEIPIIDKATLSTQAIIYDGESLLLGGLIRETESTDTSKVPVLGDIPLFGRAFKRKIDVSTSAERLFLISPRLVSSGRGTGRTVDGRSTIASSRRQTLDVEGRAPEAYLDGF